MLERIKYFTFLLEQRVSEGVGKQRLGAIEMMQMMISGREAYAKADVGQCIDWFLGRGPILIPIQLRIL